MISLISLEWGTLKESFAMAVSAIRASKLRSVLTLLGIAVGVFSIIAVMTAVGSLQKTIESGLSQLGANTFQIQKFSVSFNSSPEQRRKMWNRKNLTLQQASLVRQRMTNVEAVGVQAWEWSKTVFGGGKKTNPNIAVTGISPEILTTNDLTVEFGRPITSDDNAMERNVVILGSAIVTALFPPSITPIGQTVRIDRNVYQVIGVFLKKGSLLGSDQDNFAAIPLSTFLSAYGKEHMSLRIAVKVARQEEVESAIEQARGILRVARKVSPGGEDDFGIYTNDSLITQFNEFTFYLRLGMLVVASISLLAAGIGIMNIMLVSVTERTREIGIRKAIGARRRDVLTQFMLESVVLSQIGGVAGIILGILAGNVVGMIAKADAVIPWDWVLIGMVTCSLVGVIFGVYPAWKASTLDPIDALRYE
jgi:putative ABC transport system permease protein